LLTQGWRSASKIGWSCGAQWYSRVLEIALRCCFYKRQRRSTRIESEIMSLPQMGSWLGPINNGRTGSTDAAPGLGDLIVPPRRAGPWSRKRKRASRAAFRGTGAPVSTRGRAAAGAEPHEAARGTPGDVLPGSPSSRSTAISTVSRFECSFYTWLYRIVTNVLPGPLAPPPKRGPEDQSSRAEFGST